MTDRRSYAERCGVALALDLVGERWTLLIVRNLLVGPQRFGALLKDLPGLTTNLLTQRLKQLSLDGIVERDGEGPRAPYALTARGRALEPVVFALSGWGESLLMSAPAGHHGNLRWLVLSLRRRYRGDLSLILELRDGETAFQLRLGTSSAEILDALKEAPDLVVTGELQALAMLLAMGRPAQEVLAAGLRLNIAGSRQELRRVQRALRIPRSGTAGDD